MAEQKEMSFDDIIKEIKNKNILSEDDLNTRDLNHCTKIVTDRIEVYKNNKEFENAMSEILSSTYNDYEENECIDDKKISELITVKQFGSENVVAEPNDIVARVILKQREAMLTKREAMLTKRLADKITSGTKEHIGKVLNPERYYKGTLEQPQFEELDTGYVKLRNLLDLSESFGFNVRESISEHILAYLDTRSLIGEDFAKYKKDVATENAETKNSTKKRCR